MRIAVNVSSFHAFTRATDFDVSPSSVMPTAAAASGYSALVAGICVISVCLLVALLVIFRQYLGPVSELLGHARSLIDSVRACLPGAGTATEGEHEMEPIPAADPVPVAAGRNLSDSDRAARLRGLVACV